MYTTPLSSHKPRGTEQTQSRCPIASGPSAGLFPCFKEFEEPSPHFNGPLESLMRQGTVQKCYP